MKRETASRRLCDERDLADWLSDDEYRMLVDTCRGRSGSGIGVARRLKGPRPLLFHCLCTRDNAKAAGNWMELWRIGSELPDAWCDPLEWRLWRV